MFGTFHPLNDHRPHGSPADRRERQGRPFGLGRGAGARGQLHFFPSRSRERALPHTCFPYGDPLEGENGENPDEQFTFF